MVAAALLANLLKELSMNECEFYIESRRGLGSQTHLQCRCALTGEPCYVGPDTESDGMKCLRRLWALDYKSKHTTTS